MFAFERSPILSSFSSQQCQSQSTLPDLDHDLCNDTDDDDEQLWWDDYVSVFPAQYYTLLTPEDYDVLFNEDSLDPILNDDEEEFSFPSYTTAEASQPTTDASLTLLSKPINCPMDDEQFNTLQDIEDQTPINLIRGTRLPFIYTTRKFATCLNYHAIRRTYTTTPSAGPAPTTTPLTIGS